MTTPDIAEARRLAARLTEGHCSLLADLYPASEQLRALTDELERLRAQVAPSLDLLEAVDNVLTLAHCECPHSMRFDRGEHLSGCYLFDLNLAYIASPAAPAQQAYQAPAPGVEPTDEQIDKLATSQHGDRLPQSRPELIRFARAVLDLRAPAVGPEVSEGKAYLALHRVVDGVSWADASKRNDCRLIVRELYAAGYRLHLSRPPVQPKEPTHD